MLPVAQANLRTTLTPDICHASRSSHQQVLSALPFKPTPNSTTCLRSSMPSANEGITLLHLNCCKALHTGLFSSFFVFLCSIFHIAHGELFKSKRVHSPKPLYNSPRGNPKFSLYPTRHKSSNLTTSDCLLLIRINHTGF